MIEVNLLPGGKGRTGRRSPTIRFPSFGGLPDPWILVAMLVIVGSLGWMGYAYLGVEGQVSELEVAIEEAQRDSAQFADLIEKTTELRARRDSVAQRAEVIQEIDQGRYTWAHILDEVARAIPDFTWLTRVSQTSVGDELLFRIEGRSGNIFAMTQLMDNLTASPFIRSVSLIKQDQITEDEGRGDQIVHSFTLEATYEAPPLEYIETMPLFTDLDSIPSDSIPPIGE